MYLLLIIVQQDTTMSILFIYCKVTTCFGYRPHPSSGVHKTVTTASSTGHIIGAATAFQFGQVGHVGMW
jgi:hypothetical protein